MVSIQKGVLMLRKNCKRIIAIIIMVIIFLTAGSCVLKRDRTPEIVTPPSITQRDLQTYFPMETKATVKDIEHQVTRAKEKQVPTYHYYAATQEQADKTAQQYAKKDKADKVVKESKEIEVKNEKGETASTLTENNYYAISLERKHKIKAGAEVIDGDAYVSVGYQNRDVEYKAYYSPEKKKAGAGIEVTIAKW